HADRADDRRCDHRYSGGRRAARLPGLHRPGEDVRGDSGRERVPYVDHGSVPERQQRQHHGRRLGMRSDQHRCAERRVEVREEHRHDDQRPGASADAGYRQHRSRQQVGDAAADEGPDNPGGAVGRRRDHPVRVALRRQRGRHDRHRQVSARLLPRLITSLAAKKGTLRGTFFFGRTVILNRADIGRLPTWGCTVLITALACALYLPFLENPRVFDDWVFFSGERFFYYATHPFGLGLRLPPYFTLALTEVTIGGMPAHRLVSLALHLACSLMVFKLSWDLLRTVSVQDADGESRARTWSMVGASLFALHPVGVYAAGYLVERTIVVATLFSLASLLLFVRGLRRRSHGDALSAA